MNKNEFEILNYIRKYGKKSYRTMSSNTNTSTGTISSLINKLLDEGLIDEKGITSLGLEALSPFKVNNAVILAAGPSSRFVPLSLEKPKGLFEVKGEILIERQIKQLKEAGIKNITLVLGYKKEAFFYLKDKYKVKIIINDEFNTKNNIVSILKAKKELSNTYICSCDDYFMSNPFDTYEYASYYASVYFDHSTKEMYVKTNSKDEIIKMEKGYQEGYALIGQSYWNNEFSSRFIELAESYLPSGKYDAEFWERLVADHLDTFPTFYIKKYQDDTIFEFDFVEELRKFDDKYVKHSNSKIINHIAKYFKCSPSDIVNFKPIFEGLTNTSFIFTYANKQYVYREPGSGTDKIINRVHEKKSLELAKESNFDPTYLYMDTLEGWKISNFVPVFREPNYEDIEDSKLVINTLKKLHSLKHYESIDWEFDPLKEALRIEENLRKKTTIEMQDFNEIKERIIKIYSMCQNDGVKKCFCHGDTYKPNWMITPDNKIILIDWEYAGVGDPGIDVGYYIVDAMYSYEKADEFIRLYCGDTYNETLRFHYFAYTAIIAYYWFVWALYRESCGAVIGESLFNWYSIAKDYSSYLLQEESKDLSRVEFELLKYVEGNKSATSDLRTLADTLLLPLDYIRNTLPSLIDNNLLVLKDNTLSLTELGLKKLEPYKVSRAIIMAAGFGSRMVPATLDRPKPLVKVKGVRIIDTLLDALIAQDIKDITIIRGYKKECFNELLDKYPMIKFIDNDTYNTTNNISSIMLALPLLDNTYLCESDFLISNPKIISKYHYRSNYLGSRVIETDDWSFEDQNGMAINYKKGNKYCCNAYGISYWNKEDSKKIREYLPKIFKTEKGKQEFWETCVFDYYKDEFEIEINHCHKEDIMEIDNFYELVEVDPSYKDYKAKN